jgi:hypothetical protein
MTEANPKVLKTRIVLINAKKDDANLPTTEIYAKCCLEVEDVYAFREEIDPETDEIDPRVTVVYLKNGESFTITTPFLDFMKFKYSD